MRTVAMRPDLPTQGARLRILKGGTKRDGPAEGEGIVDIRQGAKPKYSGQVRRACSALAGKKAAVVALSIDETPKEAQDFVRERNWLSMDHYWRSEGEPGFFSDAQRAYRIDGIPTTFLIAPDGVILWRGNPNLADAEKLIVDALAKGN